MGHPPLNAFLGAPIFYNNQFIAMLGLANTPGGYSEEFYANLNPLLDAVGELLNYHKMSEEIEKQRRIAIHQSKLASIGEMAASVGHEINNPLTVIAGQTEMLEAHLSENHVFDENAREKIKKVNRSVERIANIVKGLRTFSRVDDLEFKEVDVTELVTETVDMFKEIYLKEGIDFKVNVISGLRVIGSRGRLQQVLVNLLTNARDAIADKEDKVISIQAQSLEDSILISVQDNGCGISEELKEKVFEPFFTTKDVNKGTGIGLALISSIVKQHNGEIVLESEKGLGAKFVIQLPSSREGFASRPEDRVNTRSSGHRYRGKVLVVDDEEGVKEILQFRLKRMGIDVLTAQNGLEALEILASNANSIELVITDVKMPVLDGMEFVKRASTTIPYKGNYYFITGGELADFSHLGDRVKGVLAKPFEDDQIFKILDLNLRKN